ncbi:probable rRNA-processing protein EBP2 homolog isoform X3 [Nymphaea colorata]|uniref:probable rRNA-processing protein EBP2 homolog isoform X3 n=1 Tax=Nymphaea colorata TaxID=210225 RepID=UPI00129DE5A5|nr:probable rRNA-processing protein EBP2 homolog isoform X3 [Nymphaea colorata]XP_031483925.1 probable rRNA-processing protein EBP2 homolog isoform X3 [Nymphaea colorata]XP_031483926.1 probable rRNA-processing protein EBP2 homolog isoform X3 [Nymphaea colorata]XP_049933287.1 probable rRNA-processing protein EBP2 homolog isoform X3 [Nymphaea colorata]
MATGPLLKKVATRKKTKKSSKLGRVQPEEKQLLFNEEEMEDEFASEESEEEKRDEEPEEEIDDEDEDDDEDERLIEPSKEAIYDAEGLRSKLADISWPENVDWIHKLCIDFDPGQEIDVNDDLTRELAFYTQALEGTKQAFEKLQSMGIPFLRPPDYYAEMVKSDSHMVKVKGKLLMEKKKLEEAEERRKAREAKRIAKEVQAQKLKEKAKQKKEEIESVKKWRKQRQRSGFSGGKDEMNFDEGPKKPFARTNKLRRGVAAGDRAGGHGRKGKPGKNREMRNAKYGFGGGKGKKRQNTAETTNDLRGFNQGDAKRSKKRRQQH